MQGWEFAQWFSEWIARFLRKKQANNQLAYQWFSLKKWVICSFANFWGATWAIRSHPSFLVSDLSDPLTSLIKKEGMSESLGFFKRTKNLTKNTIFVKFFLRIPRILWVKEQMSDSLKKSDLLIRSFIMSDLSKLLTVPHLSWATWAICSQYCNSFVLSNLSESLTVAHFSIATWAICSQALNCSERSDWINHSCSFDLSNLSEWANEQWAMNKWAMSE